MKKLIRNIRYIAEAIIAYPLFYILRYLPLSISSAIGSIVARIISKFHPTKEIVLDNLKRAFPNKSDEEINKIAKDCWDNIGRTAAEFPRVTSLKTVQLEKICKVKGAEIIEKYKSQNKGIIIVSAHIGNWELASRYILDLDPRIALIYRKANNPYVENLIKKARSYYINFIIQKGDKAGVRDILNHLKKGGSLGILADQKMREGIEVEFFGRKVKAPATAVELAKKFDLPIIMPRITRGKERKVDDFVFEFFEFKDLDKMDVPEAVQKIYNIYEEWITEHPSQWFWMHKRWKR